MRFGPCRVLASESALIDSTGKTHGMRFSTMPPRKTKRIAVASDERAPRRRRHRAGVEPGAAAEDDAGLGPATTGPTSGAAIVIDGTLSGAAGKAIAAVSSPPTSVKPGMSWCATGSVSTNVPLARARTAAGRRCSTWPSDREEVHIGRDGAPEGAVSVTVTFLALALGLRTPSRAPGGSASRVAAMTWPTWIRIRAIGHRSTSSRSPLGNAPFSRQTSIRSWRKLERSPMSAWRARARGEEEHLPLVADS